MIVEAFNSAGIKAVHADANTKAEKRKKIFRKLVKGEVKVVCNVDVFSTGVDVPEVACIQVCRPTQSLIWYLQALGRGLRPSPETGKSNCIIIDNAGNAFRFGSPYLRHEADLGKKRPVSDSDEDEIKVRTCKQCHFVFKPTENKCPDCGYTNPPVERRIKQEDGDLIEFQMSDEEIQRMKIGSMFTDLFKLKSVAKRTKKIQKKRDWILYRLKDKYGVDIMESNADDVFKELEDL
jgi:superfamily II DNA or RNA helicase